MQDKTVTQIRTESIELSRARIQAELEKAQGNVSKAARELSMSRYALYRHMRRFGMVDKKPTESAIRDIGEGSEEEYAETMNALDNLETTKS